MDSLSPAVRLGAKVQCAMGQPVQARREGETLHLDRLLLSPQPKLPRGTRQP